MEEDIVEQAKAYGSFDATNLLLRGTSRPQKRNQPDQPDRLKIDFCARAALQSCFPRQRQLGVSSNASNSPYHAVCRALSGLENGCN